MENRYNKLETLINELQKHHRDKKVVPSVRIGGKFIAMEAALIEVVQRKIRFISWYLTSRGIKIRRSNTSESIYFHINGQSFRVSDHSSRYADNINHQYIIKYDTCVVQVLASIKMAHFKLDEYYG